MQRQANRGQWEPDGCESMKGTPENGSNQGGNRAIVRIAEGQVGWNRGNRSRPYVWDQT